MSLRFQGAGGVNLAADAFGPDDRAGTILFMGGLGQTRQSWRRVALELAERGRRTLVLDLRGHGESDWSPDADYRFPTFVEDLRIVTSALGRPAVLVGASLGGKIALAAAGYGGAEVAAGLVMVDTAPRTEPEGVSQVLATMMPPPQGYASPEEAAIALASGRGRPVEPGDGERLRRNMRKDAAGRWRWHWDTALVERDQGIGRLAAMDYLEEAARRVRIPALLARGELSEVVKAEGVAALKACLPHLEVEVTPGAGHMLMGDQNDAFAAALYAFLARHPEL